ncbi:hypothetical protein Lfu02_76500 [Longispora fulva]|uniref:Uncharacterized protein n=1 Tax=Longispora fulva TaxID=619741 RepID=A0A8J7GJ14_9ACTN|nr:hypothetical protein [Longispora fulva]MBG6138430.1 hypothetical protein [Longispora fulva]GIG63278.1 hypothetical protein Lfu02_76500 [Longispora fulva]
MAERDSQPVENDYRHLPPRIRPEDMIETQATDPPNEDVFPEGSVARWTIGNVPTGF